MHNLNKPQCSKLPPHWHPRLDLFFSFFFFLLSFFTALISSLFLLNNEYCHVVSLSSLTRDQPWKCWKLILLFFFNKRWVKWFSFYFFFSFEPPLCDVLIASHQLNLLGFFFLSSNFLVFIFQYKEMYSND